MEIKYFTPPADSSPYPVMVEASNFEYADVSNLGKELPQVEAAKLISELHGKAPQIDQLPPLKDLLAQYRIEGK